MARCPECRSKVNRKDEFCPICGIPLEQSPIKAPPHSIKRNHNPRTWLIIAACVALAAITTALLVVFLAGKKKTYAAVVKVQSARILSEPNIDGQLIAEVTLGHELTVIEQVESGGKTWLKVQTAQRSPGQEEATTGYIPAPDVERVVEGDNPEKVVFIRDGNIWIMNLDGSGQKQLTSSGADTNPSISPDGTLIAFESSRDRIPRQDIQSSVPLYLAQIYIMKPDGSAQKRVTAGSKWSCEHPSFFPDSQRLAYHSMVFSSDPDSGAARAGLRSVSIDGNGEVALTDEVETWDAEPHCSPVVSRDGLIVYTNLMGTQETAGRIMITKVRDGKTSALELVLPCAGSRPYGFFAPALSWGGNWLSLCVDPLGQASQLGLASPNTTNVIAVGMPQMPRQGDYFHTSWTRDNRILVSQGLGGGIVTECYIYLMDAAGNLIGEIATRGTAAYSGAIKAEYDDSPVEEGSAGR